MVALAHLPGWEGEKAWKLGFSLRGHSDSSLCFPESAEAKSRHRASPEPALEKQGPPRGRDGWPGFRMQEHGHWDCCWDWGV